MYAACNGTVFAFARSGIQNGPTWTSAVAAGAGVANLVVLEASILVGCAGVVYQVAAETGVILLS